MLGGCMLFRGLSYFSGDSFRFICQKSFGVSGICFIGKALKSWRTKVLKLLNSETRLLEGSHLLKLRSLDIYAILLILYEFMLNGCMQLFEVQRDSDWLANFLSCSSFAIFYPGGEMDLFLVSYFICTSVQRRLLVWLHVRSWGTRT